MAGAGFKRPPGTKAAGFSWQLPDVLCGHQADMVAAMEVLAMDPMDVPALATARAHVRYMLTPIAAGLGIRADDPLLVEEVAFRLSAPRRLWSETARPAGRPSNRGDRVPLASDMAVFIDAMKARNPALSDTACWGCGAFKSRFRTRLGNVSASTLRRLLREGREANTERR